MTRRHVHRLHHDVFYVADGELPADGTFELEPGDTADYATRIAGHLKE